MIKVYISHSHHDNKFVKKLSAQLRIDKIKVWSDDKNLFVGDNISEKISDAINKTDYFIVVLSKNSINSKLQFNILVRWGYCIRHTLLPRNVERRQRVSRYYRIKVLLNVAEYQISKLYSAKTQRVEMNYIFCALFFSRILISSLRCGEIFFVLILRSVII